jgi:2'-5' RNA ligase
VNVSKADKSRWWIAIFLDDLPVGTVFRPGQLHLTIIPWFTSDRVDDEVKLVFRQKFDGHQSFGLKLSENVKFGPRKNVGVTLVEPSPDLTALHNFSLELFQDLQAHWAVKNPYVSDAYVPHIRRRRGTRLQPGQILPARNLTLVRARRAEDNIRQVAERIEFYEL